jgi:hypothetical protein
MLRLEDVDARHEAGHDETGRPEGSTILAELQHALDVGGEGRVGEHEVADRQTQ